MTMELISHIVKKNRKILKLSSNNVDLNQKNTLFEYFRNNKYQENYLRAKLNTQKNSKSQDLGLPTQKNGNFYASSQTLKLLKQFKNKTNSMTEDSLQNQEKDFENNLISENNDNKVGKKNSLFTKTINPYHLAFPQLKCNKTENDMDSVGSMNSFNGVIGNLAATLVSSKHNMFRVRPKNFYILKNYYKL